MSKVSHIAPHELAAALKEGRCVLVDVREPGEHRSARIPGAQLHPLSAFDPRNLPSEPGKVLVIACAAGGRSLRAATACAQSGLPATNLTGGLAAWHKAGLPVERG